MIHSFTVTNHTGKSMECELTNPWKEGLAVGAIDGLGPGQATVNVADISSKDGGLFNSARKGSRNIVITLIFVDHDTLTIEDLRRKCYTYFPIEKEVKLKFTTFDGKTYKHFLIDGVVESNEPSIFSQREGTTISIICPDPCFYTTDDQEQRFSIASNPDFTFEFSKVPSDNTELLMGDVVSYVVANLYYDGDSDTGAVFDITFKSDVEHTPLNPKKIRIDNSLTNTTSIFSLEKIKNIVVIVFLIILYFASRYQENKASPSAIRDWLSERQIVARWALLYLLFFGILIFGIYGPGYDASDFVYMKF